MAIHSGRELLCLRFQNVFQLLVPFPFGSAQCRTRLGFPRRHHLHRKGRQGGGPRESGAGPVSPVA